MKQPKADTALIYVHPGSVSAAFSYCVTRLFVYEMARHGVPPALVAQRCASGQLVEARNETVAFFLDTGLDWALFVDSDMGFDADTLERLRHAADPNERPVVGALCFGQKKQGTEDSATQSVNLRCFPTVYVYRERENEVGFQVITDYPRDALVEASATGAACVLVHRSVLAAIREKYGNQWFDKVTHPVGPTTFSEDLSFFVRVAAVDQPVHVDTRVKTSHDKGGVFLTEERWDEQEALRKLNEAAA